MSDKRGRFGYLHGAGIILRMALTLGLFIFLGDFLDRKLHTPPWFMVAGIVVAVLIIIFDSLRSAGAGRKRYR